MAMFWLNYQSTCVAKLTETDLLQDAELLTFLRWRIQRVSALVKQLRAALSNDIGLAIIPTVQRPTANTWLEGSGLKPPLISSQRNWPLGTPSSWTSEAPFLPGFDRLGLRYLPHSHSWTLVLR
jgi:hypothetical protein